MERTYSSEFISLNVRWAYKLISMIFLKLLISKEVFFRHPEKHKRQNLSKQIKNLYGFIRWLTFLV